jgi:hypothetical protein
MDVPVVNSASKPLSVSDTPPSETTSRTLNEDPDAADAAVESVNLVPLALAATETIDEQVSSPMKLTTEAASPFSKFLTILSLKISKPNVRRVLMPKAITGLKYRQLLKEKQELKEKLEEEKNKRKERRIQNKLQKEVERENENVSNKQKARTKTASRTEKKGKECRKRNAVNEL